MSSIGTAHRTAGPIFKVPAHTGALWSDDPKSPATIPQPVAASDPSA